MPFGWTELVVIFLIVFFLFGAKKLPELARSMGKSIRNFKDAMREDAVDVTPEHPEAVDAPAAPAGQLPTGQQPPAAVARKETAETGKTAGH